MLGPLELELEGTIPGAPRHRPCTQGSALRASSLTGLAVGWVLGMDPELWGLSTLEARQLTEEGQGALDVGGQGQGPSWASDMVQGLWEEWGQGLRQVTGTGLGEPGKCGQPMRQVIGRIWGHLRGWGQGAKQVIRMV